MDLLTWVLLRKIQQQTGKPRANSELANTQIHISISNGLMGTKRERETPFRADTSSYSFWCLQHATRAPLYIEDTTVNNCIV